MAHTRECAAGVAQLRALLDSAVASPPASLSPEAAHALEAQLYDALVRAIAPVDASQRAPPAEQLQVLEPVVVQHKLVFWLAKLVTFGWQQRQHLPLVYSVVPARLGVLLTRLDSINQQLAPAAAAAASVALAAAKQLTESGFVAALPAMPRDAADELQELDAASAQHGSSSSSGSRGGNRGGGAAAAAASGSSPLTPSQEQQERHQQRQQGQPPQCDGWLDAGSPLPFATALLDILTALLLLWPGGPMKSAALSAALGPLARLVVATMQHTSTLLAAAEGTRSTAADAAAAAVPEDAWDAMTVAPACWARFLHVSMQAPRSAAAQPPAMQQLLLVPEFMQASLLVLTVMTHTAAPAAAAVSSRGARCLLRAQLHCAVSFGCSSSSRSSSSSIQAGSRQSRLCRQLVPPALGISARVPIVLARWQQATDPGVITPFAQSASSALAALMLAADARMAQLRRVPIDQQQQLGNADSQLLLAAVLVLQWARYRRLTTTGGTSSFGSMAGLLGDCCSLVRHWVLLTEVQELQQRYSKGERSYEPQRLACYFSESGVVSRALPAAFVEQELLPTAMQELRCAWHELDAALVQLSSSSSTANMDFGGSEASTPLSRATRLAVHATGLLSLAAQQDAARFGNPRDSAALTVWAPHAAELAALAQGITRQLARLLQAASAATGRPAGTTQARAEKDAVAWTVAAALENVQQLCYCALMIDKECSMREVDVQGLVGRRLHNVSALPVLGPLAAAAAAEAAGVSGPAGSSSGGYGSATQQVSGLLCSTLKMQALLQQGTPGSSHPRQQLCSPVRAVFRCASALLKAQLLAPQPAGADTLLPWLALIGRCCLMWAQELQRLLAPDAATHLPLCRFCYVRHTHFLSSCAQAQAAYFGRANSAATLLELEDEDDEPLNGVAAAMGSASALAHLCVSTGWKRLLELMPAPPAHAATDAAAAASGTAAGMEHEFGSRWHDRLPVFWRKLTQPQQQHLAAAVAQAIGSDMQQRIWQQLLPAVQAAVSEAAPFFGGLASLTIKGLLSVEGMDQAVQDKGGRLIEALQQLGTALASLPLSQACNNPACVNMAGHSEQRLVGGPKTVCGGCGRARYCSRACQAQHWSAGHKAVCKQLREAGAGAAAGVTTAAADAPAAAAAVSEGAAAAAGDPASG